jgi:hypothetical protein
LKIFIESNGHTQEVAVDLDAELGEITGPEMKLMLQYVSRCGLDRTKAWAGAHVLVKLARQVDVSYDDLLEAVIAS